MGASSLRSMSRFDLALEVSAPDEQRGPELSLVVPAYDEEESLNALYARTEKALGNTLLWELIIIDDGSHDGTARVIQEIAKHDARVRGASLACNSGQTAATQVGIGMARGELIATLDADLQNDPADIPSMLAALGDADAIVGYRVVRHDSRLRRVSSWVGNSVRNLLSGDHIRDTGCALKVFRATAIRSVPLFEGMHRFLPTLLRFHGYSVIEFPVSHHPRVAGRSKYGVLNRAWVGFKDLLAVRWMRQRIIHPQVHGLTD